MLIGPKQFLTASLHESNPLIRSVPHQPGLFTRIGCGPKQVVQKQNPQSLALLNMSQSSNYLQNFYWYRFLTGRRNCMQHNGILWARRHRNARRKSMFLFFVMMQAAISFIWEVWQKYLDVCEIVHLVGRCCVNSFGPRDRRENFHVSKVTFNYICYNLKPLVEKQNTSITSVSWKTCSYNFMDTSNTFRIS